MGKRLWAIGLAAAMLAVGLSGCGAKQPTTPEATEKDAVSTAPAATAAPAPTETPMPEPPAPAEEPVPAIAIRWAEEALPEFENHLEFIGDEGEASTQVALIANAPVHDFKVLWLELDNADEDGNFTFTSEEMVTIGDLTPEEPLVLQMSFFGTIPHYGIAYRDEDGEEYRMAIDLSGMDGSLLLWNLDK